MRNKSYEYFVYEDSVYINIYQRSGIRHTTIIDVENLKDFINFDGFWHVCKKKTEEDFYVRSTKYYLDKNGNKKVEFIYFHLFVLGFPKTQHVDHKNNNTLDNRKQNLRKSKQRDNLRNRKSKNSNNTSGYRNVTWINGYWRIQLQVDGKNKLFPEKFEYANDAGRFAEEMRNIYYGEYSGKD